MSNVLDAVPTSVLMLTSFILIFLVSEGGFQLGRRKQPAPDGRDPSWMLEAAAFTLLALLLGFSFSMALGRYDARRGTLLREANAINTAFLRVQLLGSEAEPAMRADLRAYLSQRLAFVRSEADLEKRAMADRNSQSLQQDMWAITTQAARRDAHSTVVPLVVQGLNDVINVSAEERAVITTHIPDIVIIWLLIIALIASVMMGYGYGKEGRRTPIFRAVFALMISLIFGLVLDLDRPQRGIIRVNLAPLQKLQQSMDFGAASPGSR